jgi:transcriptional regulator with XRE-family HTH domain
MNFQRLHGLLIRHLNHCLQRGDFTERSLARRVGISQPHIHNALKGSRLLSWRSADSLLRELNIDLVDLATRDETPK